MLFDKLIRAELVHDNRFRNIPSNKGIPAPNQMRGTDHEKLAEVACRLCYDDQTEILTKQQGWILFKDLDPQNPSEVMTLNPTTMEAEWQIPSEVIRDSFDGELIAYDSRETSLWVTPNHRHWVKLKGKDHFEFILASWLMNRKAYIPLCARDWKGELPDQVIIPDVEYETGYKYKNGGCLKRLVQGKTFIGNQIQSLVELMVYFATEGFTTPKKGVVTITGHHVEEVRKLLDDLGYPFRVYTDSRNGCPFINVVDKTLCQYMDINCGRYALNKKLPRWVLDLPKINLQRVYHVFGVTDCSKPVGSQMEPTLNTSSEILKNNFQEILVKLGYASYSRWRDDYLLEVNDDSRVIKSKSRRYRVGGKAKKFALIGGKKKLRKIPYCGEVFCVRTENGVLVTRRNGKVAISGNCYDSLGVDEKTGKTKGRSSEKLHQHILDVKNHSVYEHCVFTVLIKVKYISPFVILSCCLNRPGLWVELVSDGVQITLNHRSVLEWDQWSMPSVSRFEPVSKLIGKDLSLIGKHLAPALYPNVNEEHLTSGMSLIEDKLNSHQAWVSVFLSGSRGFGNEQVRHGDHTGISQRSTRFCSEEDSPYVTHPLITKFLNDEGQDPELKNYLKKVINDSIEHDRSTYRFLTNTLKSYIESQGVEGTQARKQAWGAARGYLGNALYTEMIFSASCAQWRWMLSQRGSELADAEIRVLYISPEEESHYHVLNCLKSSAYAHFFTDLESRPSADGVGRVLH